MPVHAQQGGTRMRLILYPPSGSTASCPEPEALLHRELSHQHFVDAVGWYGIITGLCLT